MLPVGESVMVVVTVNCTDGNVGVKLHVWVDVMDGVAV